MSNTTKLALFFSSYSPLFTILGIRLALSWQSYVLWGVTIVSVIFLFFFFTWSARNIAPLQIQVNKLSSRGEFTAFVVTYIIPFLALNQDTWQDWAAILILLAVIAILYINSPLIHVNPVLALLGWRTYEIVTDTGTKILITRKTYTTAKESIRVVKLGENFVLEVENVSRTDSSTVKSNPR